MFIWLILHLFFLTYVRAREIWQINGQMNSPANFLLSCFVCVCVGGGAEGVQLFSINFDFWSNPSLYLAPISHGLKKNSLNSPLNTSDQWEQCLQQHMYRLSQEILSTVVSSLTMKTKMNQHDISRQVTLNDNDCALHVKWHVHIFSSCTIHSNCKMFEIKV